MATLSGCDDPIDILKDVTAHLVAAISLLERGSKKAAPSDKMFDMMIADYKRAAERSRAFLLEKINVQAPPT